VVALAPPLPRAHGFRAITATEPHQRAPLPPVALAARVGGLHADSLRGYEDVGVEMKNAVKSLLPEDWSWEGKRVLDFGCGAGRTLRHFLDEAAVAEFHGCDIDGPSVKWLATNLSPPFHVVQNAEEPPLVYADGTFNLIWAVSVFTHLTDLWSAWLLELHRILLPDGLLLATFMGQGMARELLDESWDEDRIGMNVLRYGQPWDRGGPFVFHSEWWIREHWGRLFSIEELRPAGFARPGPEGEVGQGVVRLRKGDLRVSQQELERIDAGESREIAALQHNVEQVHRESLRAREDLDWLADQLERVRQAYESSTSWRVTLPLRAARDIVRRRRAARTG
jgi:SAM-dependent methyltransferase